MSTVVSVKNWTKTAFQTTTVVFSELDTHLDDFWEPKVSNPVIESNQKVVFGKMVHPSELTSGANFLVTLLLTVNNNGHACSSSHSSSSNGKDNFISLKTRIKGTKTGATVYCCASSYPETSNITKPQWRKGSDKVRPSGLTNSMFILFADYCIISIAYVFMQTCRSFIFCHIFRKLE